MDSDNLIGSSQPPDSSESNQSDAVETIGLTARPISGEDLIHIHMVSGRTIASTTDYRDTNLVVTTDDVSATAASVRSSKSQLGKPSIAQQSPLATNETAVDATSQSTTSTITDGQDAWLQMASSSSIHCGKKMNAKIAKTSKLKFLILGSENVGKTLILKRMQNINWPLIMSNHDQYRPTVGPDLHRLKCGTIEAIDIGGEQRFLKRAQKYCELFTVFVIVFDVTNAETFLMARYWMDFLHHNPLINVRRVVLIGNKTDLGQPSRRVSTRLAKNLALTFGAGYLEISAKMDLTMDKVFETLEAKQQDQPINLAH